MKTLINSKTLIVCAIALTLSIYAGNGFAAYTDSILEFSDNFNSPDGDVSDNVSESGRQAGDWAVLNEIIIRPTATIITNRVRITRDSGFHPDHTLNDIEDNLNFSCDGYVADPDGTYALFGTELNGSDHDYLWWFQNGSARPIFQIDGASQWTRSLYRNYEWDNHYNTGYNHINVLYSKRDSANFWTACFCNGEPITAGQGNHGTILRIANPFASSANMNFVCWAGKTTVDVAVDNLVIKSVSPTYDESDWTDDASSLINSSKVYTHKINCGGGSATINGVTFDGHTDQNLTSNTTWRILNNVNVPVMTKATQTTTIGGNGATLAESYYTAAPCSTLILSGLSTGAVCKLTLYCNADAPDNDIAVASSDADGGITTLNGHGSSDGKIISLAYVASDKGIFSITFDSDDTSIDNSWRLYAFSNEITAGGDQPVLLVTPATINFNAIIDDSTNAETLVRNIGGGTVSGIVTGISAPFSISTNWYSATSNSPCTLTVTFSPTVEGSFTNTLHFSGEGGSQDVTLTGEAIPECSLLISGLMLVVMVARRFYD